MTQAGLTESKHLQAVKPVSTGESLLLDVVRVTAAIVVAFGHLTEHFFSTGWPDLTKLARAAVVVFFVLSGYVIRYVTTSRPGTLTRYLEDRATRIYSVAIPALLFTFAADSISRHVNPDYYGFWEADYTHPIGRLLSSLFFTAQLWHRDVRPLSNSPFWSLNYEVFYYILYGCAFYLKGYKRLVAVSVAAVLGGPKMLLLFPLWLLGCLLYDWYHGCLEAGTAKRQINLLTGGLVAVSLLCGLLYRFSAPFHGVFDSVQEAIHDAAYSDQLGMSGGLVGSYLGAIVVAVLLLQMLWAARHLQIDKDARSAKALRTFASGTFPIYLFHFPLYVLIACCIPYDHTHTLPRLLMLVAAVSLGVILGPLTDRWKDNLRTMIHGVTRSFAASPSATRDGGEATPKAQHLNKDGSVAG